MFPDVGQGIPVHGFREPPLPGDSFPDLRAEETCSVTSGSTLGAEMTLAGTHAGPLTLPSGDLPPTGRPLRFEMAFFTRIDDDGLVADERRYYDVADQLEQLGLGG